MALTAGTRLGPYEITEAIGAGGMGEVYRATDTNLKRQVAIKVLPAAVAGDAERLARFQREAEVLAQLNHPNIAQIYGVEKSDGTTALVMELVEGPTLAHVIAGGHPEGGRASARLKDRDTAEPGLSITDALPIARQIVEALEAAHEQGIIHRDLKPANVKVRPDGTVKVLDFGLAKALSPEAAGTTAGASALPTITSPAMTQLGMILGTAAYMAPEQAKGRAVDARADIWAFGAVLFEMLTGRRAFDGDDVTEVLGAVVRLEPAWELLPATTPARVQHVLRACLQKALKQRIGSMQDVRLALDGAFETTVLPAAASDSDAAPAGTRPRLVLAMVAATALVAAIAGWMLKPVPEPAPTVASRFTEVLPVDVQLRGAPSFAVAPDGRSFVFSTDKGLYLRTVGDLEARVIPGADTNAIKPSFSPDGQSIAYAAGGQLMRIPIEGGKAVQITGARAGSGRVRWEPDGTILFDRQRSIWRVAASGSAPAQIITVSDGESAHQPEVLPGGEVVLFTLQRGGDADDDKIVAQSLSTGERKVLVEHGRQARYLSTGHLVYRKPGEDGLFGVRFDPASLTVSGDAVKLVADLSDTSGEFDIASDGTLVYLAGERRAVRATPVWVTREQHETPITTTALTGPANPRLSPDGTRLALIVDNELWVYYFDPRPPVPLTMTWAAGLTKTNKYSPVWSPDGRRLAYGEGTGASGSQVMVRPADRPAYAGGSGPPQPASPPGSILPFAWLTGDRLLALKRLGDVRGYVQWSLSATDKVETLAPPGGGLITRGSGSLSADGRWLAFVGAGMAGGALDVFVRPYPDPGPPVRVSVDGGVSPVFSKRGRELFFIEYKTGRLMAVRYGAGQDFIPEEAPRALMDLRGVYREGGPEPDFDVAADGRFLLLKLESDASKPSRDRVVIVQHWFEELTRLMPTGR